MRVRVITASYDAGYRSVWMGKGPEYLVRNGLIDALTRLGLGTEIRRVELDDGPRHEVASAFELDLLISGEVSVGLARDEFPLVLSGNCNSCVGALAGIGNQEELGLVWLDGHADFHTPETSTSSFTDCMGLSIAVGHCWEAMAKGVPGYSPVPEENVVLVGTRKTEPRERERLHASDAVVVGADHPESVDFLEKLDTALLDLRGRVRRVYLLLDLDVLDPQSVGGVNEFAPTGGLTVEEAERIVRLVRERVEVVAAGLASYDPAHDPDGAVSRAGMRLAGSLFD